MAKPKLAWSSKAAARPEASGFLALAGLQAFPTSGRQRLARAFDNACDCGRITSRRLQLIHAVEPRVRRPVRPDELIQSFDAVVSEARDAAQERVDEIERTLRPVASDPVTLLERMAAADTHVVSFTPEEIFASGMMLPFPVWMLALLYLKKGVALDPWQERLTPQIVDELVKDVGVIPFLQQVNFDLESLGVDTVTVETARSKYFAASREQVGAAFADDQEDVQRLLRSCVFLDPSRTGPEEKMELKEVRWGYQAYYDGVKAVLDARRSGSGMSFALKPEEATALHDFILELQGWWRTLPARLQPFFSGTLSLPYRLCWSFLATLARNESSAWVIPFTLAATRQLLERQRAFLEEMIADTEAVDRRRARTVMLGKLADGPCLFRDLLRRYAVQRRDVHEPVLKELVNEGLIRLRQDGYLELSGPGRKAA